VPDDLSSVIFTYEQAACLQSHKYCAVCKCVAGLLHPTVHGTWWIWHMSATLLYPLCTSFNLQGLRAVLQARVISALATRSIQGRIGAICGTAMHAAEALLSSSSLALFICCSLVCLECMPQHQMLR
jgi:hypothetical protein